MLTKFIKSYKRNLLLFLIILIAILLRFYNIDYMEFKNDEAINSFKALSFIQESNIPFTAFRGTTGVHEFPIFIYILLIPYAVTSNPVFAAGFIAFLNVLGIFVCYLFVMQNFNTKAAFIAISFYAVSPWQVLFSRKIWNQNLIAPFIIFFLYFLFKALYQGNKKHIIYALVMLGILLQLHLSAAYFVLIAFLIIIFSWEKIDKKYFLIGMTLFLLTFAAYFIYQFKTGFADIHNALGIAGGERVFHKEALMAPFQLLTTNGFGYSLGNDLPLFEKNIFKIPLLDILPQTIAFISVFFLIFIRKLRNSKSIFLILWLTIGTVYMTFNKVSSYLGPHYFQSFIPLLFIMSGVTISYIMEITSKACQKSIIAFVCILIVYQLLFNFNFLNFIKERQCINGDYGPTYSYQVERVKNNELCICEKCDFFSRLFIIKIMRSDNLGWKELNKYFKEWSIII